jgi:molecular chaperone DnaJ
MDHYKTLEIERTATQVEIKAAYRKKAMQFHPDRNPGDKEAETKFKEVQTAYDILSDPTQKNRYDAMSHTTTHGPGYRPFGGIYDNIFTHGAAPQAVERGRNIQVNVEIELKDVLLGITRNVVIPKREKCAKCDGQGYTDYKPCPTCSGSGKTALKQSPFNIWITCGACRGTGRSGIVNCAGCTGHGFINNGTVELSVKIPPGVETGHQLRLHEYGEPSRKAEGKPGDLNVIIIVKEHKLFKRHGVNLTYEYPVGYSELCLGGQIEIPTLTGSAVVTIPKNTVDYTQFRLKGMGLPYFHGGKGDLVIIVKLIMPSQETLNSNKELFQDIAKIEGDYLKKERERFKI